MCKFKPFNKHLLVEKPPQKKPPNSSPVLLPEGAQTNNKDRYSVFKFIWAASDCDNFLLRLNPDSPSWATRTGTMDDVFTTSAKEGGVSLVVDSSMVEDVKIEDKIYNIVHQNYVVGIIDE